MSNQLEGTRVRFWVHAGPESMEVILTRDALIDDSGVEVLAAVDPVAKQILLSHQLPPAKWSQAILEQMHRIHDGLFGPAQNSEFAEIRRRVVYSQFKRDLDRQGGGDTLMGLSAL